MRQRFASTLRGAPCRDQKGEDMSQIEELQGRIANALDRISQGLDLQANTQADPEEISALQQALEEERTAAQQLEERNKALNERIAALEAEVTTLQAQDTAPQDIQLPDSLHQLGASVAATREANQAVRAANERLREANKTHTGEPHLINSGMMAELDSLKATQDMDRAEMTAILETLEAVLGSSQSAAGGDA